MQSGIGLQPRVGGDALREGAAKYASVCIGVSWRGTKFSAGKTSHHHSLDNRPSKNVFGWKRLFELNDLPTAGIHFHYNLSVIRRLIR